MADFHEISNRFFKFLWDGSEQFWTITGASTKEHPAPYPLELASRLVQMFSFTNDTVLDPFCGTATTMLAALKHGRNSIGVELDTAYCHLAAARLRHENMSLFGGQQLHIELKTPLAIERVAVLNESAPKANGTGHLKNRSPLAKNKMVKRVKY